MDKYYVFDNITLFYITVINSLIIVILIITNIASNMKIRSLHNKYHEYMVSTDGEDIEELLRDCFIYMEEVTEKNREIETQLNEIKRNLLSCVQKTAIIRYNAFDDVGSDLSFTAVLLDGNDNGVVITSLFSRDNSIIYGKPIVRGKSKHPLSAEEIKAIDQAVKGYRESYYV